MTVYVSESTIYGWLDCDYIPFLMAGDLVRFDSSAIHNWMLAEADRKREERGLKSVLVKVARAPGSNLRRTTAWRVANGSNRLAGSNDLSLGLPS